MVKAVVLYGPRRTRTPSSATTRRRTRRSQRRCRACAIRSRARRCDAGWRRRPYQRMAELTFEDMDALQAGLGSGEGQAAVSDIPNFATGGVTIFFAEID